MRTVRKRSVGRNRINTISKTRYNVSGRDGCRRLFRFQSSIVRRKIKIFPLECFGKNNRVYIFEKITLLYRKPTPISRRDDCVYIKKKRRPATVEIQLFDYYRPYDYSRNTTNYSTRNIIVHVRVR